MCIATEMSLDTPLSMTYHEARVSQSIHNSSFICCHETITLLGFSFISPDSSHRLLFAQLCANALVCLFKSVAGWLACKVDTS